MKCLIIDNSVLQDKTMTLTDKLVYSYISHIIRYMPEHKFNFSNSYIASQLGLNVRSVNRSVLHLKELDKIFISYSESLGVYSNRTIDTRPIEQATQKPSLKELFDEVYNKIK